MLNCQNKLFYKSVIHTHLDLVSHVANVLINYSWWIGGQECNLSASGWSFNWNNHRSAVGYCDSNNKIIYISKHIVGQNLDKPQLIEDSIRHEIAHAIDFQLFRSRSQHDDFWNLICKEILCSGSVLRV
ncbi:MAG: SprT-like domain-containing protein [Marinicella sp.]